MSASVGIGRHDAKSPRAPARIEHIVSRFIQASLYLNFGPGWGLPLGHRDSQSGRH